MRASTKETRLSRLFVKSRMLPCVSKQGRDGWITMSNPSHRRPVAERSSGRDAYRALTYAQEQWIRETANVPVARGVGR